MGWSQLRSARACKPADVQIAATRLLTEVEDALAWSTMRTATGPAATARLRSLPETLADADDDDDGSVLSLRRVAGRPEAAAASAARCRPTSSMSVAPLRAAFKSANASSSVDRVGPYWSPVRACTRVETYHCGAARRRSRRRASALEPCLKPRAAAWNTNTSCCCLLLLCNLCFAIYVMQSILCNRCYAIYGIRSKLCIL